jgi:hypothetical protein
MMPACGNSACETMGGHEPISAVMMHAARGQIAMLQIAMLIVALSQTRGYLGAHQWTGASP